MKTTNNDISVMLSHIEDERLIALLDGEVDTESQKEMQLHLESCWDCRSRLSSVERSIEKFLRLRKDELLPPELPPNGTALELFRQRLDSHRALVPSHSFFRSHLPIFRSLSRRISNFVNITNYSLKTQVLVARAAAVLLLFSIATGFIYLSGRFTTVSASEILQLSIDAQAEQTSMTDQPVVHQRIRIVQTGSTSNQVNPVTWEIWNDTVNSRVRMGSGSGPVLENTVLSDLRSTFRASGMNEHRPLSAASYKSWTHSLAAKTEDISEGSDTAGAAILTINTKQNAPVPDGRIIEARFSVRANDYHPIGLYIKAKTADGEREFELREDYYEVVSLKTLDPSIFADPTKVEIASTVGATPTTNPSASPAEAPVETANTNTEPASTNAAVATTEAEVEVLDLLNRVGADISEQLNVTRTADGRLLVEGLAETDNRKSEILRALAPARKNPAISIKIQTIEEAARALAKQKQQSQPGTVDSVEVEKRALPVDSELRQYFGGRGGDTEEQIRRFASRAISHSQSALFQASALRRLANRFTAEQLKTLEPAARTKWLNILKGYASVVRRETANLRDELQPVFGSVSDSGDNEAITSDADLIASSKRLYEFASANDRVVRAAFTLSSGNASVSAIKTPQFRRSLGSAESLASALVRAR